MSALSGISEWKKILLLFLFFIAGAFLFSILGTITILIIYGMEVMSEVSQSIYTPQSIEAMKWIQTIQGFGMFAGSGILLAFLYSNQPWKYLGLRRTSLRNLLLSTAIMLISIPAINLLSSINEQIPLMEWMLNMETNAEMLLNAFLSNSTISGFLINIVIICIIPAFGEEFIFRGLLQKHFIKITKSQVWGIIITALIFSAFHLQFKGFITRFALGLLLGFLYSKSGSIWLPITAHAFNNFVSVLVFTLMDKGKISSESGFEEIGSLNNYWILGVASIALVVFAIARTIKPGKDDDLADEKPDILPMP